MIMRLCCGVRCFCSLILFVLECFLFVMGVFLCLFLVFLCVS